MSKKPSKPNCCLCGEPIQPHAGDARKWPVMLPTPDSKGANRPHHMGCVLNRVYPTPSHSSWDTIVPWDD